MAVTGSTFSANQAIGGDGGARRDNAGNGGYGFGGGIYSPGRLLVSDSTFSANRAIGGNGGTSSHDFGGDGGDGEGGGLLAIGTGDITGSTFSANEATGGSGGSGGDISYNGANGAGTGGGISNEASGLTVTNSTFTANQATGDSYFFSAGGGGGIFNAGTLTVGNSTLSANAASSFRLSWGGAIKNEGTVDLRNTIMAHNTANQGPDLFGPLTTSGYNLIGNTQGGSGFADTDLLNVNPRLGPLRNNGGPTQTMDLQPRSPALNAGALEQLGMADQRGVVRSGGVNIGAYQASASAFVLTAPDTVTAGAPFDVPVTALDSFGQTAYGYTGTVTFSTTDPDPGVVLPADYTFTAADQGAHTFASGFTLMTPGDQTINAIDAASGFGASAGLTVQGGGSPAPGHRRASEGVDSFFAAFTTLVPFSEEVYP